MKIHTTHFDDCGCLSEKLRAENAKLMERKAEVNALRLDYEKIRAENAALMDILMTVHKAFRGGCPECSAQIIRAIIGEK